MDRVLSRGYIRGDAAGNLAIVVHLLGALILIGGGAIQLIPQVRDRADLPLIAAGCFAYSWP
jgi:hypothetical protein